MSAPAVTVVLDVPDEDLEAAVAVMHRAFAEYTATGVPSGALLETAQTLREERAGGVRVAVASLAGRPVAVVKHHELADGRRYFGRLGVDPDARGRGLARILVEALRDDAGAAGLQCLVRAEERGNIALYERLGMEVTGHGERVSRTGATLAVVEMRDR